MRAIVAGVGISALLALGVTACGSDRTASGTASAAESLPAAAVVDTTAATTETASSASETTSSAPDTSPSASETTPATPAVTSTNSSVLDTSDPADAYLGATAEVYRRPLPTGRDFVLRSSTESYAEVFGLTWSAPTGSADTCLGDHAALFGVPGDVGPWGSAWVASPLWDDPQPTQPAALVAAMSAAESTIPSTEYLVIRVGTGAAEAVLVSSDGTELDRAPVSNDIAMLVVAADAVGEGETVNDLSVIVVSANGEQSAPVPLAPAPWGAPSDCSPGEAPRRPLPQSGPQPADPTGAAAQIRDRYASLVDISIPFDHKPSDLLDDDTGVQSAIDAVYAGQYGAIAASAAYSVDDLVFTAPDEAWFRYSITTSASTFTDRFGRAVFNGHVWQITRSTLCQDLALAQTSCEPDPGPEQLPPNPEWDAAWQQWVSRAMLYSGNDGCGPLSQC
ncbi:MAG: hypothetical protein JWN62_2350 [Acidimicrobiales bacterium]|nr:hypothetical protein [Acidimicrobiales bacterium]